MRGVMGTLIIFMVCLVVVVLYIFLGKGQISLAASDLETQIAEKEREFTAILKTRDEIPTLKASLPLWREQLEIFTAAIPVKVDDHVFFGTLVEQMDEYPDVKLLSLDSVFGGPWLGQVEKDDEEVLTGYGIDVESAKSIRVSFFTLKLFGEFDEVLTIIENLKKYRRLYTIDMISGPATGGSGSVAQNTQPEITPIQVTGRLYFNLPEPKVDVDELTRMYLDVLAGMLKNDMVAAGQVVIHGKIPTTQPEPGNTQTQNVDAEQTGESEGEETSQDLQGDAITEEPPQADDIPGDVAIASLSGSAGSGL